MIEARTIDLLRFLAVAFAFPSQERLTVMAALANSLELGPVLCASNQEVLEIQYHRLFSGMERCSPHETEYGPGRSVRKAVELADIAGFYKAFGLAIDDEDPEMVDHISLEFDFLAFLGFKERYAVLKGWDDKAEICSKAYRSFWKDHCARWVRGFLESIEKRVPTGGFYQSLAATALQLVDCELNRLGLEAGSLDMDRTEVQVDECLGCSLGVAEK
ncbi:MAG: molecular chaperone TorD family protein [Vulcanimicrobiota bacterium]